MNHENTIFKIKDEFFSRKQPLVNQCTIMAMDSNEKLFPLKVFRNDIFLLLDIKFTEAQNKLKSVFYKCLYNGKSIFVLASNLDEIK